MKICFAGYQLGSFGNNNTESIKLWDYILIVAACFAPMTGWRVWRIGPAEVICSIWCLKHLFRFKIRATLPLIFFAGFIGSMLVGSVFGYYIAPSQLRTKQFYTWFYFALIAISIYRSLVENSAAYNAKLLNVIAFSITIWQLMLYYYSIYVDRSFFGAQLWYSLGRYSGGGTNPHQVALALSCVLFVFLWRFLHRRTLILSLLFAYAALFLMLKTDSSTGKAAIVLGIIVLLYLLAINASKNKLLIASLLTIGLLLAFFFFRDKIYSSVMDWISEDKNGTGRLDIFSSFGRVFAKSPLFGLGPGIHGRDGAIEFHNTYLEVAIASGVVGFSFFASFTVIMFKRIYEADWRLIPIIVALYAYGLGGFAMRRLVYWILSMVILALADSILREREFNLPSFMPKQYYRS